MKKLIILVLSILIYSMGFAQATDLFISEYIEGSSNNKAIEIYNGTGAEVDLSEYTIKHARNGAGWGNYEPGQPEPGFVHNLTGMLSTGDVWVIVASDACDDLQDVADESLEYRSVVHFNGDDAVGLFKNDILIDVIGIPDEDPGTAWAVAGVSNATKNHTLVRKPTVTGGNTDWVSSAGTTEDNSEWIVYSQDTFIYLGSHTMGDDTTPPTIFNVLAYNETTIAVTFSEELEEVSAETESNYTIVSRDVIVENAELDNDNPALVTLTVSGMTEGDYTLIVNDVEDLNGNAMENVSYDFSFAITKSIVINEINYNPIESGTDTTEFIELYNCEPTEVVLSGYSFTQGVTFEFPSGSIIPAGGYLVIAVDSAAFEDFYGFAPDYDCGGGLLNNGEAIEIQNNLGNIVDYVFYDDNGAWPSEPDGDGPSLELTNPNSDNSLPENWAASEVDGGTPGSENSTFQVNDIVFPQVYLCNYPNPFSTSTVISFFNSKPSKNTKIEIYNIKGQLIKQFPITNSQLNWEQSSVEWEGTDESGKPVSNGIYLYKLIAANKSITKKMLLLR